MALPELIINETKIPAGKKTTIMLPMPSLYDGTSLSMPIHILRGREPGPTLLVTAAIHGDEVNGIEIIRRLLRKKLLNKLKGTLITIPIVNIYGFLYQDRYLMDRRDLNRAFPGSKKGSLAARLAHLIGKEIISKVTHCIDLHTGSLHRSNLPQIRANLDTPETTQLAKAFNAPIILHAELRDGSMRQYANEKSIPFLLYEAGESLRFDEPSIRIGLKGILNVMDTLNMTPQKDTSNHTLKSNPTISRSSYWIRAPYSGILHAVKGLGKKIKKGELLAKISNPTTGTNDEYHLLSPLSGIIIGKNNLPMVHEGAALFHIASFEKLDLVAEQIECLQDAYREDTNNPEYF